MNHKNNKIQISLCGHFILTLIISLTEHVKMKYILTIFLISQSLLSVGQNLFISSGLYHPGMKVDLLNGENKGSIYHFDYINLLYEQEINKNFSLKSGLYLHNRSGSWIYPRARISPGGAQYYENYEFNYSITSIDLPFLITYNLSNPAGTAKVHFNLGPYMGYGFNKTIDERPLFPYYLKRFDFGYYISSGMGTRKWQICCYFMKGLRDLKTPVTIAGFDPDNVKKVTGNTLGFNLTWIIRLAKKSEESH
jgi:hypothetical protein